MKKLLLAAPLVAAATALLSFNTHIESKEPLTSVQTLYDSIVMMDAAWEDAYNNCKMEVMSELLSQDMEFYHDQGGLSTSQPALMKALKDNICGKVTRELKAGSIEVSPVPGYGAVEIGMHRFHNANDKSSESRYARFVHVWKKEGGGKWRITRVISLHAS